MTHIESLSRPVEDFVNNGIVDPALIHDEFKIAKVWGGDSNALDMKLRRMTANDQFEACRFSVKRFEPLERLINLAETNPHSILDGNVKPLASKFLGVVWQQSVLFTKSNMPMLDQYVFDGVTRARRMDEMEAKEDLDFRGSLEGDMFRMIQQINLRSDMLESFNQAAAQGRVYNPNPDPKEFRDGFQAVQAYWEDLGQVKTTIDGNYSVDMNALRLLFSRVNFLYEIVRRDQVKEGGLPLIGEEVEHHRRSVMGCYKRMVVYNNWSKMCGQLANMVQEPS